MEQHEETFPNAKVLLLAAGGASLAALLIALAKRGNKEEAGERIEAIEQRQEALSAHLDDLATALTRQTLQTRALIDAVNRLLSELAR